MSKSEQASTIQEIPDEVCENIPPEVEGFSGLKVQLQNGTRSLSVPSCSENKPLGDASKSRFSGFQSSLTPIFKLFNLSKKYPMQSPLNHGKNSKLLSSGAGVSDAPGFWLMDETLPEVTLLDDTCDASMQLMRNDSALPDSAPSTPLTDKSVNSSLTSRVPSRSDSLTPLNFEGNTSNSKNETIDLIQANVVPKEGSEVLEESSSQCQNTTETLFVMDERGSAAKLSHQPKKPFQSIALGNESSITLQNTTFDCESRQNKSSSLSDTSSCGSRQAVPSKPAPVVGTDHVSSESRNCDEVQFLEMSKPLEKTLSLEVKSFDGSQDSEQLPVVQTSPMDITQDQNIPSPAGVQSSRPLSELSGHDAAESSGSIVVPSKELPCFGDGVMKMSLEETQIVLENSKSSLEHSRQTIDKIHLSADVTSDHQPASPIHDVSMTEGCSKEVPELHCEQVTMSASVGSDEQDLPNVSNTTPGRQVSQGGPNGDKSSNETFTAQQPSKKATPTALNTTESAPSLPNHNRTLSNENSPKRMIEQTGSFPSESSPVTHPDCSAVNSSKSQRSSGNPALGATFNIKNHTCEITPTKNSSTFTASDESSSHPNSMAKPTSKLHNLTSSFKDGTSDAPPTRCEENSVQAAGDPNVKNDKNPEAVAEPEVKPVSEQTFEAVRRESLDHSQSSQSIRDRFLDSLNHQNSIAELNRASTFNLDDTLDLKVDSLLTSTPMPSNKMFNFSAGCEENQNQGAQRKLYTDVNKPATQASSSVPPNPVSDRKPCLKLPMSKCALLSSKPTSQLVKQQSGLPMTRRRAQVETLRNAAVPKIPPEPSELPNTYNLRDTTTGLKPLNPGLRRLQASAIPSGIQKAPVGLRPPLTRSNAPASLSTNRPCGLAATNPATKTSLSKKHPLTRGDALPSKRKKTDSVLSNNSEASTAVLETNLPRNLKQPTLSQRTVKAQRDDAAEPAGTAEQMSCDTGSKAKILKPPANFQRALLAKPPGHGCANCALLLEENKKLKEELLKYRTQEEEG